MHVCFIGSVFELGVCLMTSLLLLLKVVLSFRIASHIPVLTVRYYAIATPSATQRLLLGLLEAPPSWAPDALDAAVQLVELLRAAEDYASGVRVSVI